MNYQKSIDQKGGDWLSLQEKILNTIFPKGGLRRKIVVSLFIFCKRCVKSIFKIRSLAVSYIRLARKRTPIIIKRDGLFVFVKKAFRYFTYKSNHFNQHDYDWLD